MITITRSPSKPTLAYILFPAGLLAPDVTRADVEDASNGIVVRFVDGGRYSVRDRRLTLPSHIAAKCRSGRHAVLVRQKDQHTLEIEI